MKWSGSSHHLAMTANVEKGRSRSRRGLGRISTSRAVSPRDEAKKCPQWIKGLCIPRDHTLLSSTSKLRVNHITPQRISCEPCFCCVRRYQAQLGQADKKRFHAWEHRVWSYSLGLLRGVQAEV